MQRKPGFPAANCNIKMPHNSYGTVNEPSHAEEDTEQRRQQLINFAHAQWGFNNWSWSVTKQELDFVDFASGKFTAGVVAFVSITVKTFDIHRENIGYATALANNKGFAIYKARKCAVTNALRDTLLSFGGSVATELMALEPHKHEANNPITVPETENNQNIQNVPIKINEPKNFKTVHNDSEANPANLRSPHPMQPIKNTGVSPPVAVVPLPPAANRPPPPPAPAPPPQRHGSNDPKPTEEQSEEEARAERRRRQRQAQEEFRQKQILRQKSGLDDKQELSKDGSLDSLLMNIPTQDIVIEETGREENKRKSPAPDTCSKRRASNINKLDVERH